MAEERRSGRRAPIAGVRVTYEGATGAKIEAEVLDIATGGLFIRTEAPLAAGKRLALDLHILGEPGPWSALGRVVWARTEAQAGRPAGMGVKLIDVDDATVDAISRLVETREPTAPGVGQIAPTPIVALGVGAPERERTLMGVGADTESPAPVAAAVAPAVPAPARPAPSPAPAPAPPAEPEAPHPPREQSVAIDLVTAKKEIAAPPAPPPPVARPRPAEPPAPARADTGASSARWVVVVLLLVVAGIAAYVLFDGFLKPMGR